MATYDVAIVGYGPVGQTLAVLLAQRGVRVGVFEKQPAAYPLPRAVHFDGEVARILQAVGVTERMTGRSEVADAYEWRNAAGDILLRFTSRAVGSCGWPEATMFAQPDLEQLLDARVRTFANVDVQRGAEVVDLHPGPSGVTVTVGTTGGARRQVDAAFVVGCDGANSFVRTHVDSTV